jgi:hypothetical protein
MQASKGLSIFHHKDSNSKQNIEISTTKRKDSVDTFNITLCAMILILAPIYLKANLYIHNQYNTVLQLGSSSS